MFAIAITLLALDLHLPALPAPVTSGALARALIHEAPRFVVFFISFEVIGIFWLGHHRVFGVIERFSRGLANVNLLFLMCIVVLPFATRVLGDYGNLPAAAAFYAGCMVATSLTSASVWIYARRRGLLNPSLAPETIRSIQARYVVALVLFSASTIVALFSPPAAQLVWVLTAFVPPAAERWVRRRPA